MNHFKLGCLESERLMLFQAYFDGSGKISEKQCKHVTLANIVVKNIRIDEFNTQWSDILHAHARRPRLPTPRFVKSTEAFRRQGEFRGWNRAQVDGLLCDLAKMALALAFHVGLVPADAERYRKLPEEDRRKLKGPNELAFEVALMEIDGATKNGDFVMIYADDDEKEAMEMYRLFGRYKNRHAGSRDKFCGIGFVDDRVWPLVQAADLLAYVGGKSGSTDPSIAEVYSAFSGDREIVQEYSWGEDGLGSAQRVPQ